jgi:hypothetical protein
MATVTLKNILMPRHPFGQIALTASLLAIPVSAAAAAPAAETPESGWVTLGSAPPGSSVKQLQGISDGAGNCKYEIDLALAPGQDALYGQQIRHDPSRCVTEVAELQGPEAIKAIKAEDQAEGAAQTEQGAPKAVPGPSGSAQSGSDSGVIAQQYVNSQGHLRSLWEDPVDLTVAEVTNTVNWYWDAVHCLQPGWGSYRYYWYSPSGWRLEENNWNNVYWCESQESSSYAHYFNGAFCANVDTHAYWDRNWVWGDWDGWLRGQWNTWVTGGCTDLLRFEYHLVRDIN